MTSPIRTALLATLLGFCALPFGCGGSSGTEDGTGRLTLRIADAPVDAATHVFVKFDAVEIKPAGGPARTFDLANVARFDLLAMTDGLSALLLDGAMLPAGQYNWIRLLVNQAPDDWAGTDFSANDFCYMVDADGTAHPLRIPSAEQTGLKLNRPFVIPVGGEADFALDFDLRRSLHIANDKYILRPTIRIVDNTEAGAIRGDILNLPEGAVCSDGTVYLFQGAGIVPDEIDNAAPEPIASASAHENDKGGCVYHIAFVGPGDYTVAFTWDAALDDPALDNSAPNDPAVTFPVAANVNVAPLEVANVPLTLP